MSNDEMCAAIAAALGGFIGSTSRAVVVFLFGVVTAWFAIKKTQKRQRKSQAIARPKTTRKRRK